MQSPRDSILKSPARVSKTARFALAGCLPFALASPVSGQWLQWGGPGRDFQSPGGKLAESWPDGGPAVVWSRELGAGYTSILVDGDALYTMYRDGDQDVVVALNASDGKTRWEHRYAAPTHPDSKLDFGKGPSATPLIVGDRIFTIGFTAILHCLDKKSGKPAWSHDLVKEFGGKVQEFGYAASPLQHKDRVIVLVGGKDAGVVAFEQSSGRPAWKSEGFDISYASPILADVGGEEQVIFMSSIEAIGLDAAGGKLRWRHLHENRFKNNCMTPLYGRDGLLLIASHADGGSRVLRLARQGDKTVVEELWHDRKLRMFHGTAVRAGEVVYASVGGDGGAAALVSAFDVKTGRIRWQQRGFARACCVGAADNRMVLLDENGWLALLEVSPEKLTVKSKIELMERVSWTPPTLVGRRLYLRDNKRILALDAG